MRLIDANLEPGDGGGVDPGGGTTRDEDLSMFHDDYHVDHGHDDENCDVR